MKEKELEKSIYTTHCSETTKNKAEFLLDLMDKYYPDKYSVEPLDGVQKTVTNGSKDYEDIRALKFTVFFEEIKIKTTDRLYKHVIKNSFIVFNVYVAGRMFLESRPNILNIFRTKFSREEIDSGYIHSHVNIRRGIDETNYLDKKGFCLGTGEFANLVLNLNSRQNSEESFKMNFEAFLVTLPDFLATESAEGRPYIYIADLRANLFSESSKVTRPCFRLNFCYSSQHSYDRKFFKKEIKSLVYYSRKNKINLNFSSENGQYKIVKDKVFLDMLSDFVDEYESTSEENSIAKAPRKLYKNKGEYYECISNTASVKEITEGVVVDNENTYVFNGVRYPFTVEKIELEEDFYKKSLNPHYVITIMNMLNYFINYNKLKLNENRLETR